MCFVVICALVIAGTWSLLALLDLDVVVVPIVRVLEILIDAQDAERVVDVRTPIGTHHDLVRILEEDITAIATRVVTNDPAAWTCELPQETAWHIEIFSFAATLVHI